MNILLAIYFIINAFFAGMYFQDNSYSETKKRLIFATLLNLFFGILLIIIDLIKSVFNFIGNYFQVRFFINYKKGKYDKLGLHQLERINRITKQRNSNKLDDRIFRYCTKLINQRNNVL